MKVHGTGLRTLFLTPFTGPIEVMPMISMPITPVMSADSVP